MVWIAQEPGKGTEALSRGAPFQRSQQPCRGTSRTDVMGLWNKTVQDIAFWLIRFSESRMDMFI